MTDQRTLKKIIKDQREAIAILENAVKLADEFKKEMRKNWKAEIAEIQKVVNDFKPEWADHLEGEFGQEGYDLRLWRDRLRQSLSQEKSAGES